MESFSHRMFSRIGECLWQASRICACLVAGSSAASSQTGEDFCASRNGQDAAPQVICLQRFDLDQADIKIDGFLNEAAWAIAPVNGELRVISPDTLAAPPYRTELRVFYTERGLYFSFDLEQPEETIVARHTARDNVSENRDHVSLSLDTSGTGLYGYWMNIALGDDVADGTLMPQRQYNREWDGAWYGATQRSESGWTAEAFVPWSQLGMPKQSKARLMGVYISRKVAHLNESWAWPALPKTQAQFMSILPKIQFVDVDPRQQWSVFPFVSTTIDAIDNVTRYKAGMDMFWRPSTNFQLTATVNPDFGAVESDDIIVNFTADETFFPEKRLFFLEGQDIFNTTARSTSTNEQRFTVIHTRRIGGRPEPPPGLDSSAREALRPTDLIGATKATGQINAFRYGVIAAVEDETTFETIGGQFTQDGRSFGSVRVLYENNHGAAYRGIGLTSTLVANAQYDARVYAADFHILTESGRWNVDGQVLSSERSASDAGYGAYADIHYTPRQGLQHTLELTAFDDTLDVNDFGFQRRNDIRGAWYRLDWTESGLRRIRSFTLAPYLRHEVNGDGYLIRAAVASELSVSLNNLDRIEIFAEHLPRHFDDRNSFGNGTFEVEPRQNLSFQYRTDTARTVSAFGRAAFHGEYLGGDTYELGAGIIWQPVSNVKIDLSAAYFDRDGWLLHQQDGDFTTFGATQWLPRLSLEYFPTSKQQLRLAMQWVGIRAEEQEFYTLDSDATKLRQVPRPPGPSADFSQSQLNVQLRYRWQIAPLSDLYIVYTKIDSRRVMLTAFYDLFRDSWESPLIDQLVVKLRYRFGS